MALFKLALDQMGNDFVHQAFPLMVVIHRHAAQGISKAAAGGYGVVILVKHDTGIIQIGIPADSFLLQQCIHLGIGAGVRRVHRRNYIIRHKLLRTF